MSNCSDRRNPSRFEDSKALLFVGRFRAGTVAGTARDVVSGQRNLTFLRIDVAEVLDHLECAVSARAMYMFMRTWFCPGTISAEAAGGVPFEAS
jgi:hypothetical protein